MEFQHKFDFDREYINVLIIENMKYFSEIIQELLIQINGDEGRFVFSQKGEEVPLKSNAELIIDFFSIDCNQRKMLTKLYSQMDEIAHDEELIEDTLILKSELHRLIFMIEDRLNMKVACDERISIEAVLKAVNIRFDVDELSISEKIIEYMEISSKILKTKLFIFVNLKAYLLPEELDLLFEQIIYNKYNVLIIESTPRDVESRFEKRHIIDMDLCEI